MSELKVGILLYENCTTSMIFGVLDILSLANIQSLSQNGEKLFAVELISETGTSVNSFNNFTIKPDRSIRSGARYDLIYIPGFLGDVEEVLIKQVRNINWLKRQFEKGTKLAAACNGNFLLAETGILDRRKATTHWSLIDLFKERYKTISVLPEKIIVDEGDVISAAGVTAYFNLALFLIERYGSKDLSLTCAKVFLVDSGRRIQTPYQMYQVSKKHGDEDIVKVQDWVEVHYKDHILLEQLMDISNLGKKTLIRRFKKATGETPMIYLQKIRIENAKKLLESGNLSFNEITWEVGYSDASSFHKIFKSETGLTPGEYRSKFSLV